MEPRYDVRSDVHAGRDRRRDRNTGTCDGRQHHPLHDGEAAPIQSRIRLQLLNFGYALLGRVVETISGQPYEKFAREQVLAPSGAACMEIGHSLQAQSLPGEVKYYDYPGAPLAPSIYGTATKVPRPDGGFNVEAMDAHGGWVASTIDYLRFVLSVDARSDRPDILAESTINLMIARPTIRYWSKSAAWYAKGWQVRPSLGGRQLVAHRRPSRNDDNRRTQLRRHGVGRVFQLSTIKRRRLRQRARLRNVECSGRRHELALIRPVPILRPLCRRPPPPRCGPLMAAGALFPYLGMQLLMLLQHLDELSDSLLARLGLLRGLNPK